MVFFPDFDTFLFFVCADSVIAFLQKAKHSRDLGVYRDSAELKQASRCSHCSKHCIIFYINVKS